jgi:hypothetical protein
VFSQFILFFPQRRKEYEQVFSNFFSYCINHNDAGILDTELLSFMMSDIISSKQSSYINLIEDIFDKGLINITICGTKENVLKDLEKEKDLDYNRKPIPENLTEFFDQSYLNRYKRKPISPETLRAYEQMINPSDPYDIMMMDRFSKLMSFNRNQEAPPQVQPNHAHIKANKKVGRNDPCPCNSGKKFKKCCLNKTKHHQSSIDI